MAFQMTWQPYRRKSPPMGLKNLGNTCYLNSVLQCLTFTPPFANFCLSNKHSSSCPSWNSSRNSINCPFCLVEKRIGRSLSVDNQLEPPLRIVNSLQLFAKHFRPGRQEDAHEFLCFVIEACNDVCVKMYKAQNNLGAKQLKQEPNTIVKEIFGGVLLSQVKCLSCGAESNKMDKIMHISLEILHSGSLKEAFGRFFQAEVLDGNNRYSCEKCKKLSAASKQLSIFQAPNVLVIQLKRFEDGFGGKIDRNIIFEEHLGLAAYMSKDSQDPRPEYALCGTVVHSGYSQDSGHYYAYVKDANGRWYCCNDAHVSAATIQAVLSEKVYMLFFLRSNPRTKRSKEVMSCKPPNCADPTKSACNGGEQRPSVTSNLSAGVPSSRGTLDNGSSKVHPRPQIKFANLKSAGSQLRRTGVENGNGTSKPDVTLKGEESECFVQKTSGRSSTDASFSSNSSISNCQSGNGKYISTLSSQSPSLGRVSEYHFEMNEESCKNGSTSGSLSADVKTGNNGCLPMYRLQKTTNHSSCNGKSELNGSNSRTHVGKDFQSSLPDGRENSEGKVSKRQREEHEDVYIGNGNTEQANFVLKLNAGSRMKSESNGAENLSELDKLKETLCQIAKEYLQSCGWCDDVRNAMRARKRICVDPMLLSSSDIEFRKLLKHNIKDSFIQQFPDPLKQQLLQKLDNFFRGKH